jgi:hypothetical protein
MAQTAVTGPAYLGASLTVTRCALIELSQGPRLFAVWPSELDLMAQLAGLRLRDRWANWNREPFTTDSRSHVSVWQKPKNWVRSHQLDCNSCVEALWIIQVSTPVSSCLPVGSARLGESG